MRKCDTGTLIEKPYGGHKTYYIRLNFKIIDDTTGKTTRYTQKDIRTGLAATRKNKAAAEAMIQDLIAQYNSDGLQMYLQDYCSKWVEDKKNTIDTTTYEGYVYRAARIRKYFEDKHLTLGDVSPQNVKDFYTWLMTTDVHRGGKTVQGYSNRSIKDTADLLSMALAEAVTLSLIPRNPAEKVKVPQRPVTREQRVYIDDEQITAFKSEIAGHRLETPFLMALFYGMRREEIIGLKWKAIRNGKIYIEHTVAHVKTTVAKDRAKTASGYRTYPLIPEIRTQLEKIKQTQDFYRSQMGDDYHSTDYVFTWEDGRPYRPDYLTRSFKKLVRRSDVLDSNLTLHGLRVSCINLLIHSGTDIKDTQVWVGHADIATTMDVYASVNEKQQTATANTLADIFFGNS